MKLYSEGEDYKLYQGNMLDMLDVIQPNSIDSIVTDPPYGLTSIVKRFGKDGSAPAKEGKDGSFARLSKGFMGKEWDGSGVEYNIDTWRKCYTVLKSGGYLVAFGGTRTFHRIACAIEDAGFEIRDTIMWLYGSGFPKSMNIAKGVESKLTMGSANSQKFKNLQGDKVQTGNWGLNKMAVEQGDKPNNYDLDGHMRTTKVDYQTEEGKYWDGWGTCLKPAYEPIIVARKPCEGSCVDNVLKYGVGGLNIDECRIDFISDEDYKITKNKNQHADFGTPPMTNNVVYGDYSMVSPKNYSSTGRFPANVILTYDDTDKDEVCGGMPDTVSTGGSGVASKNNSFKNIYNGGWLHDTDCVHLGGLGDSGSAARYFYCAKASKKDRDDGLENFEIKNTGELQGGRQEGSAGSIMQNADGGTRVNPYAGTGAPKKNTHPTVKPTELMQYLVRLVTPRGGTVLDPFNGSGSTGKATLWENKERGAEYKYIGIELTEEYLPITKARLDYIRTVNHNQAVTNTSYKQDTNISKQDTNTSQVRMVKRKLF